MTARSDSVSPREGPAAVLAQALSLPGPLGWGAVGFALRTTAASLVALYLAFLLDLDEPKWAAMTVWIVAQSSRGMSLSKSQYRLLGTIAGAGVGLALVALFAQTPELFFVALAAWLGLCTALSTGLRNFRSYGAVLAGYTAAIIGISAASAPDQAFEIATARVVYISLGIVVEAVFSAVFAPDAPLGAIRARLDAFLRDTAAVSARALRGEDNSAGLRALFASAIALDSAGEYAAAASGEVRRRYGHLRGAVAACLAQLSVAQTLRDHLARRPGDRTGGSGALVEAIAALMDALTAGGADGRARLAAAIEAVDAPSAPAPGGRLLRERVAALLARAREADVRRRLFADATAPASRVAFRYHVDPMVALRNALRAALAMLAAAAVWMATAWPSGGSLVVIVAVVCALFATRPNAVAAGLGFLKGAGAAIVAAALCNFVLLPNVSGFPMLALVIAPFLIAGGIAMRHPATAAPATSFTLFLWDLIGPDNAARPEFAAFLNGGLALLIGVACGTTVFALVAPADPARVRARLHAAVRRDLQAIGAGSGRWSEHAWLSRTADRFSLQAATDAAVPEATREADLRGMLAALAIGHAALALHALRRDDPGLSRAVRVVSARLAEGNPRRLAAAAALAVRALVRRADATGRRQGRLLHAAALLDDIAQNAAAHPEFLGGGRT